MEKFEKYRSYKELSADTGKSVRFLKGIVAEMRTEIGKRYNKYVLIDDGKTVLVNYLAFIDYMVNRKQLKDKNARKYVEPYDPTEIAWNCGWKGKLK